MGPIVEFFDVSDQYHGMCLDLLKGLKKTASYHLARHYVVPVPPQLFMVLCSGLERLCNDDIHWQQHLLHGPGEDLLRLFQIFFLHRRSAHLALPGFESGVGHASAEEKQIEWIKFSRSRICPGFKRFAASSASGPTQSSIFFTLHPSNLWTTLSLSSERPIFHQAGFQETRRKWRQSSICPQRQGRRQQGGPCPHEVQRMTEKSYNPA